jgi:hypothetical protein
MKIKFPYLPVLVVVAAASFGCKAEPIFLHTYDKQYLGYPEDFPNDQPTILAFLNANHRTTDKAIRPLRAFSAREELNLVGVMTYSDNSFLESITVSKEMVFPVMLDPNKKMFDRFGVNPEKCPAYLLISPNGDVIDRQYDLSKVKEWYKPVWVDKALGRRHRVTPEERVEQSGG